MVIIYLEPLVSNVLINLPNVLMYLQEQNVKEPTEHQTHLIVNVKMVTLTMGAMLIALNVNILVKIVPI